MASLLQVRGNGFITPGEGEWLHYSRKQEVIDESKQSRTNQGCMLSRGAFKYLDRCLTEVFARISIGKHNGEKIHTIDLGGNVFYYIIEMFINMTRMSPSYRCRDSSLAEIGRGHRRVPI